MHHWTDSDVHAIVGLVARGVSTAEDVDGARAQILAELCRILGARGWRFETGTIELSVDSTWIATNSMAGSQHDGQPEEDTYCQCSSCQRWQQFVGNAESAIDRLMPPANGLIVCGQCDCRSVTPHPFMACWWVDQRGQAGHLEYQRGEGETPFTERDQAILRVVMHQLDSASFGKSPLNTKTPLLADLSKRQREVLDLLLVGKSCKQIASELQLSVYTVNDYIKAIYRRFDVSNRAELLAAVHLEC